MGGVPWCSTSRYVEPKIRESGPHGPLSIFIFTLCMPEPESFVNHFEHRTIYTRTPDGRPKKREIFIPDDEARRWNESLLTTFEAVKFLDTSELPPHAWVSGGMAGAQLLDGVLPHKDNWTFYKLDIKNAFPSVEGPVLMDRVEARAEQLHLGRYVARSIMTGIDEYATTPLTPGLPQGAPASPYLFNFYLREMDELIGDITANYGLTYTRYLDDITISSPKTSNTLGRDTRRFIRQAIEATPGMMINHSKSQLLRRANHHITLTGTAIYPDGRIQPRPELIERIFGAFDAVEEAVVSGETITMSHLGIVDGYHSTLKTMSVEPYNATMLEAFARYHTVVRLVRAALDSDNYEIPGRQPSSPKRASDVHEYLTQVVYGDASDRTMFAYLYPEVWRAFLELGMFNVDPKPLPRAKKGRQLPQTPGYISVPETLFEGGEGEHGDYLI